MVVTKKGRCVWLFDREYSSQTSLRVATFFKSSSFTMMSKLPHSSTKATLNLGRCSVATCFGGLLAIVVLTMMPLCQGFVSEPSSYGQVDTAIGSASRQRHVPLFAQQESSSNESEGQQLFGHVNRRRALQQGLGGLLTVATTSLVTATATTTAFPGPAVAASSTGPNDGNLPDLPAEAVRSYLQYRTPLQTSTDFYVFDLYDLLDDPSNWGSIGELFQSKPTRIEREFTNVMRVVGLSMPPDEADEMRDAQFDFEKAMATLSRITLGIRRDLPVELDPSVVPNAKAAWDDGRVALNKFLTILNSVTGLNEMKTIPAPGPTLLAEYPRSQRKYLELKKKIKLCQNRGGPTLSQAWGQLMVSGYMQDSCGIPDLEAYFYQ